MCTVTYIPTKNQLYLTSNRDEKNWRTDALAPAVHSSSSGKLIFPKDGDAGGTWIAAHENGNIVVFLNGGLTAHVHTPPYRRSRGLVLLDILEHSSPFETFKTTNLSNIEPFTAVICESGRLFECRWDGSDRYAKEMNALTPHIWSSVTLYDEATILKRKNWFEEWISENPSPTTDDILHFHQFTGDGDEHNDLMMNRDGKVFTVSITSIAVDFNEARMEYLDLKNDQHHYASLMFETSIAGR